MDDLDDAFARARNLIDFMELRTNALALEAIAIQLARRGLPADQQLSASGDGGLVVVQDRLFAEGWRGGPTGASKTGRSSRRRIRAHTSLCA